jgi:hypothetical protein
MQDRALGLNLLLESLTTEEKPMVSQRFRIKIPIIAIVMENGLHTTLYTKAGDEVMVLRGPLDGLRLVEVQWNERTALMFTIELREHAELLSETHVPAQEALPASTV